MARVTEVDIRPLPPERYEAVLGPQRVREFEAALSSAQDLFAGLTIWMVNSTARGGGVAEMLRPLVAYARGAGVDVRWVVISGNPEFFAITKRVHNHLHNFAGDGGPLGDDERRTYEATLEATWQELRAMVKPGDIVVLHDPQTAGLVPMVKESGRPVVWRCHVGIDHPTELARNAWAFLADFVRPADAYVFSRRSFAWDVLDDARLVLIAPSIDAFSPKNQELDEPTVRSILATAGLLDGPPPAAPVFQRIDGRTARVESRATIFEMAPLDAATPMVLQVSRWDRLKDPLGVIRGFAEHVTPHSDAHLVYAGPAVDAVTDDPEGHQVLAEATDLWRSLPEDTRERVHLVCLPMDDGEENAAMVNALQRRAYVVVQKSLAEGFGLTVAEAMWKGRPVIASRIGGIQDQVEDGRTGILLDDPTDLARFGQSTVSLLQDPARARSIGTAAMEKVRDDFLGSRSLVDYTRLLARLAGREV